MTTKFTNEQLQEMLLKSVVNIGQVAEEECQLADANSIISQRVIDLIKDKGIHKLILPKRYGGPQINFDQYTELIRTVGYYNLSAAWLTYFYSVHNSWLAFLPEHRQQEILQTDGLLADVFAPVGKAVRVEGGFILNAIYHYVSGIKYSEWIAAGAKYKNDKEEIQILALVFHTSNLTIKENWDSLGLRGTGSNTIIVNDVFIPDDMVINMDQITKDRKPLNQDFDEDYLYYNVPFQPAFYVGFPAMAIGGAERAIEEFKIYTARRIRGFGEAERKSPRSQRVVAIASIKLVTAKSLMEKYITMLETDIGQHNPSEYKMIRSEIIQLCVDIAVKCLLTLGASALLKGNPIEMITRDLLALATHNTSLYEDAVDVYGKHLFGFSTSIRG